MRKIFDFMEDILSQNEKYSDEVIAFSVLERIVADKEKFDIWEKYIGKSTRRIVDEIQRGY